MLRIGDLVIDCYDYEKKFALIIDEFEDEFVLLSEDQYETYEKSYVNHYFELV